MTPSGHIICIGIDVSTLNEPKTEQEMQDLFKNLSKYLEVEQLETNWGILTPEKREEIEHQIKTEVIEPALVFFEDNDFCCAAGSETCPIDTNEIIGETEDHSLPIWEGIKSPYLRHRGPRIYRILFPIVRPFIKIFTKYLLRKDKNRYKKIQRIEEPKMFPKTLS